MFRFTIRELWQHAVTAIISAAVAALVMYGVWQADRAVLALRISQMHHEVFMSRQRIVFAGWLIAVVCFDPSGSAWAATKPEAGAVVLFLGTTRELTGGRQTVALDYEAYREMAEAENPYGDGVVASGRSITRSPFRLKSLGQAGGQDFSDIPFREDLSSRSVYLRR